MSDLLFTEKDLVASLKDYIRAEEDKLEQIKRYQNSEETSRLGLSHWAMS